MAMNLGPGERVVFEGHPSWRAIVGFYLKGIVVLAVLVLLVVLYGKTIGDGVSSATITLVLIGGAAIVVLVGFLRRVATSYMITNRRLYIKHGLISRDVQETKIERVQDVNYTQSLYQRLMQIGDVDFDTAAHDTEGDFVFAGVSQPEKVVDRVHHATEPQAHSPQGRSGLGDERRDLPPDPPAGP
ncbi:MAG: PH domain-containing protein [Solirubrobacterales bacterium]|nr:PH domain-containing protein [Solirubrobacterales bacterium]